MIIQPLITLSLLGILFFTFIQSRSGHVLRGLMALCVLCGLVLTWMPGLSHVIANAIGVGRGADLVFYCWILASMLALVALYFSIHKQNRQITELTRALAIATARHARDD